VPGTRVRGSRTGRPLMVLLELLGQRLALRILWELREESLRFRELQARCGDASPTVVNKRLAELRQAGVVEHEAAAGYRLTASGRELLRALAPLNDWAKKWARQFAGS
jgi:DNA-binding HxlR family transcriptional regulator